MSSARRLSIVPLLAIAASALLVGASSQPPFDPLTAVPQGAAVVITVGNPAAFIDNAAKFLRNAGLDTQADAIDAALGSLMQGLQADAAGQDGAAIAAGIDTGRRMLVALYPQADDKFQTLLLLPLKASLSAAEEAELGDAVARLLGQSVSAATAGSGYPGYAAIGMGGMEAPVFGSAATIDLASLSGYPASSLAIWADAGLGARYLGRVPGVRDILGGDSSATDGESGDSTEQVNPNDNVRPAAGDEGYAGESATDNAAQPEGLEKLGSDAMAEGLKAATAELTGIEFALTVQKDRAWFRIGARAADGGALAAMADKASKGDKSLPYLAYCDADALMSFAWSAPPDWSEPLLEALYGLLMPGSDLVQSSMASMRAYAAAAGVNGGASVNIGLSDELVRALGQGSSIDESEGMALVSRGLTFDLAGAMELRDRQAFRDAAAAQIEMVKDPAYADILAGSGLSIDIERNKGTLDGLPFDAYRYRFGDAPYAPLLEKLLAPVYVYRDDKAFIGFGAPEKLRPMLARGSAQKPLQRDQAFSSLRAGASPDTRAIWYLSTKALNRLVMRLRPADSAPLAYDARSLLGILGWFDATPTTMGFGVGIGAADIKAAVELLKQSE